MRGREDVLLEGARGVVAGYFLVLGKVVRQVLVWEKGGTYEADAISAFVAWCAGTAGVCDPLQEVSGSAF